MPLKNTPYYLLILPVTLILIFLIYSFGFDGAFYYDDFRPLGALAQVKDVESALIYITTETSGLLGRPISMLTFLLNIDDWPNNPQGFLLINTIIHCINGLLVFGITHLILKLCYEQTSYCKNTKQNNHHFIVSCTVAIFWLILPIHVATNLISIQRMASLSVLFILSGINIYLYALYKQKRIALTAQTKKSNYLRVLLLQISAVTVFTLLAMFSKENGILLPVFILVLELTLLQNIKAITQFRHWRITLGTLALIAIILGLVYTSYTTGNTPDSRTFTTVTRTLNQPIILIEYLQLAFFPNTMAINPFHDNYQLAETILQSPSHIISIFILISLLIFSIIKRAQWPLLAFSVLWFLTAHLIESSFIALEPVFLHRNYLALVGPCLAIVFAGVSLSNTFEKYKKVIIFIFYSYLATLSLLLYTTTSLWGTPNKAAESWFVEQKGSERASGHLTQTLLDQGRVEHAWAAMEFQVKNCQNCIDTRIKAMVLSCMVNKPNETLIHFEKALDIISNTKVVHAPSALPNALYFIKNNQCNLLDTEQLSQINKLLIEQQNLPIAHKKAIYLNLYNISLHKNNIPQSVVFLEDAWKSGFSHLVALKLVNHLIELSRFEEALLFVRNEMCTNKSTSTHLNKQALKRCEKAEQDVLNKQKVKGNRDGKNK